MKNLELTEQSTHPRLSMGISGVIMDRDATLAIGIGCDDRGYCWPGDAGTVGDTVAGNLSEVFGGNGPIFHAKANQIPSIPFLGHPPQLGNLFNSNPIMGAFASMF
jgi:hypothetical protein